MNPNSPIGRVAALLRPDQVRDAEEAQALYPCPSSIRTTIIGVAYPESTQDVQKLVRFANEAEVALYPLSTGNNWGYGGGHPAQPHSLIVDMGRLNKIIAFDAELGIVTLEPGVSQMQLYEFLKANKAEFYVPVTGSNPGCSLIGNALERGYGVTPVTDHFAGMISLKSVLPDGSIYEGPAHQLAIGTGSDTDMYLKGLFSQGNFGIVTSAALSLSARAQTHAVIMFGSDRVDQVSRFINMSRQLLLENPNVVTSVKFFNLAYSVALNEDFPKEEYARPGFDAQAWLERVGREQKLPVWMSMVFIGGPDKIVRNMTKVYKRRLRPYASHMVVFTPLLIRIMKVGRAVLQPVSAFKKLVAKIESMIALFELMDGKPQARFLKTAYWRAGAFPQESRKANPGRDGAGLIWFAPIIPFRGEDLLRFDDIVHMVCAKYKFIPVISVTTISDRALSALVPILFDPENGEAERAHACYAELFATCQASGYLPYRGHVHHLDRYADPSRSKFWQAAQLLKNKLDPTKIMAPGRYDGQPAEQKKVKS